MTLRLLVSVLLCGWLSASSVAQTPSLSLPSLTSPPGAASLSVGGWPRLETSFPTRLTPADPEQQYSVGLTTRLLAAADVTSTATHYGAQLAALGWKKTFDGPHPSMVVHRYTVGSPVATQLGSLLVLSLPEREQQFVGIRLVRSQMPWQWQPGGRSGGGGANGAGDLTLPPIYNRLAGLRLPELVLPSGVRRLEQRGGGASSDAFYQEARFETLDSPSTLMKTLELQFAKEGWVADIRGGDAVQAYTSFLPPGGVDYVVCLILTSIPGANATDSSIWAIRTR
jgi:hypothetical protein